tara:strand:- start:13109 stop:14470 length:1362 start_codon:yes stop_codon:yes gene_type:complete
MFYNSKLYFKKYTSPEPLAVFRILFGLMMFLSIIRFWSKGWIETLYLEPKFHFSYYGFDWVKPLGEFTYILFIICGLSALFVSIGYRYRFSIITFFLSFTYIELMDKTTYLNHYYFISVLSFIMIFLPADKFFSVDNIKRKNYYAKIPKWTIDSIKILISIVYIYAGLAKINSDWLLKAMPLKIWLPSKYDIPVIGDYLLQQEWVHYLMSWSGMIYDLSIPFLLFYKKTRAFAFILVIIFHLFTAVLFPIGMFPYIMIIASLIFFDSIFHNKIIHLIKIIISPIKKYNIEKVEKIEKFKYVYSKLITSIVIIFLIIQLIFPFRFVIYPGNLFWNEEGYRFSWRVMLMEKMGYTSFKIVDGISNKYFYVDNKDFLTPFQEKQMSFQPDFIIEYAHFLGNHFTLQGHKNIEVYADSFVALNGRRSKRFIDPKVNLMNEKRSLKHYSWIIPFKDEI